MPLDRKKLADALFDVFSAGGEIVDIAKGIATAYTNYAKDAMAGTQPPFPDPVIYDAKTDIVAKAIESSLQLPGTPDKFPTALSNAMSVFWTSVPFGIPPISGLSAPPTYVFVPTLTILLSNTLPEENGGNSMTDVSDTIATQLDLATKSVLITFSSPPPPAGPPPPALLM